MIFEEFKMFDHNFSDQWTQEHPLKNSRTMNCGSPKLNEHTLHNIPICNKPNSSSYILGAL